MINFDGKHLMGDPDRVEETLLAADEILLSELLDIGVTQDLTIRYLCGLMKLLDEHSNAVPEKYQDVKESVKRVKGLIGARRRSAAFEATAVHVAGWVPTKHRPNPDRDLEIKRY